MKILRDYIWIIMTQIYGDYINVIVPIPIVCWFLQIFLSWRSVKDIGVSSRWVPTYIVELVII